MNDEDKKLVERARAAVKPFRAGQRWRIHDAAEELINRLENPNGFPASNPAAIRHDLRRIASMREWQSIETAPKDGAMILVWDGIRIETAYWEDKSVWVARGGAWVNEVNRSDTIEIKATHWMPLPEAPKTEGQ